MMTDNRTISVCVYGYVHTMSLHMLHSIRSWPYTQFYHKIWLAMDLQEPQYWVCVCTKTFFSCVPEHVKIRCAIV